MQIRKDRCDMAEPRFFVRQLEQEYTLKASQISVVSVNGNRNFR